MIVDGDFSAFNNAQLTRTAGRIVTQFLQMLEAQLIKGIVEAALCRVQGQAGGNGYGTVGVEGKITDGRESGDDT